MHKLLPIDLRAFDGESAAAPAAEGGNAAPAQPQSETAPGAQAQQAEVPARPTFDELVKGDYKKDFDERVQQIVSRRLKNANAELDASRPILAALQQRYGIEDGEGVQQRIMAALDADDAYWSAAADQAGMSVDQYKRINRAERESAALRSRLDAQQTEANRNAVYQMLNEQAEQVRAVYPSFDVAAELRDNPQFGGLIRAGIDMMTAYQVAHQKDIIAAAVQDAENKTMEKVRAKQQRPSENGTGGGAAATFTGDVSKLSRKEFKQLEQRVLNGERIVL